jgi:hypothetical protein
MKCPTCNAEMESGSITLQARRSLMDLGIHLFHPCAELRYNGEPVLRSQRNVFGFQRKIENDAYLCEKCTLLTFKYCPNE